MIKLKQEIVPTIEYECILGCIGNCVRYMGMDLSADQIFLYGDGIADIQFDSYKQNIGNPCQFDLMAKGLRKYGIQLLLKSEDADHQLIWKEDESYLAKDIPVIVCVESKYLTYDVAFCNNHSSGHTIILTGIDREANTISFVDCFIPTQIPKTCVMTYPFDTIDKARKARNYERLYFEGNFHKALTTIDYEFFQNVSHYLNPKKDTKIFYGVDMIPGFSKFLKEKCHSFTPKEISKLVQSLYFDIRMQGVLAHYEMLQQYIQHLPSLSSDFSDMIDICIDKNQEIIALWNKILKRLIRFKVNLDLVYIEHTITMLHSIKELDQSLMDSLYKIGRTLGYNF